MSDNRTITIYLPIPGEVETQYKLSIPDNYKPKTGKGYFVMFSTVYPGLKGFSTDLRNRFFAEDGTWGPDRVNIFLSINSWTKEGEAEFLNRNDQGSYILHNVLMNSDSFFIVPLKENLEESEKITKYKRDGYKEDQAMYLIKQNDGRISVVECNFEKSCDGNTTWKGEISIEYQFMKNHLVHIADLDRNVVLLIEYFKPIIVHK